MISQDPREVTHTQDTYVLLGIAVLIGLVFGIGLSFVLGTRSQPYKYNCKSAEQVSLQPLFSDTLVDAIATSTPLPLHIEPTIMPPATSPPSPTASPLPSPTASPQTSPTPSFFEGPLTYGYSVQGRPLTAYRLGTGPSARAIIGGIHGGYEWNTVELLSDTLKYLSKNQHLIPLNVTLYLIPNMNPDGYMAGRDAVKGRMNANLVDLNRNWDYEWQETASHGSRPVSAGSAPFSEPETRATRDFILDRGIEYVIFYHSAMGVVFSGADHEHSMTFELTEMLSEATGYPHRTEGIPGQITTGDSIDWLSMLGIAATEIELTTHDRISEEEQERNFTGIQAFLNWSGPTEAEHSLYMTEITWITHTVRAGESLLVIARSYGIEPSTFEYELLLKTNQIKDENSIIAESIIRVPKPEN